MKYLALVLMGVAGFSATGSAQTAAYAKWPPAVGMRTRVLSPALGGQMQIGTVEGVTGDTLRFLRTDGVGPVSLTPSEINTIEVSGGTHTAKAKWGIIGFLGGAAAGAMIGAATYRPCTGSFACIGDVGGRPMAVGVGAVLGSLAGGIVGTLWGARSHETWIPVQR